MIHREITLPKQCFDSSNNSFTMQSPSGLYYFRGEQVSQKEKDSVNTVKHQCVTTIMVVVVFLIAAVAFGHMGAWKCAGWCLAGAILYALL